MNKRWTSTVLLALVVCAGGAVPAWADPVAAPQEFEPPAISSPAPGLLEPAPPLFAATCSSVYQSCLAGCGSNTTCRNQCYCNYLDCIGSDAPCPM